jgi:DNA-directed RNA polymerase specialized sigma24 family protein
LRLRRLSRGWSTCTRDHGARRWRAVFAFAGDRTNADDAVAEAFARALARG